MAKLKQSLLKQVVTFFLKETKSRGIIVQIYTYPTYERLIYDGHSR